MSLSSLIGGPPYPLNNAQMGGIPSAPVDVPPLAVFLTLHAAAATISMVLAESHRRSGRGLAIPIITFLFSGERVLACALRIAWASRPDSVRVAVVSQVLLQAGVLLLLLLNVVLAERLWLDRQPGPSTRRCLRVLLGGISGLTISAFVTLVVSVVVSVYYLDQGIIDRCRDFQRAAATYVVVLALAPVALLLVAPRVSTVPIPQRTITRRFKVAIVLSSCLLCTINTGFKAGVVWARPKPLFNPAWYHSRTCLYTFVLGTEVVAVIMLFVTRIDLRFRSSASLRNEGEHEGGEEAVEHEKNTAGTCTQLDVEHKGNTYSTQT